VCRDTVAAAVRTIRRAVSAGDAPQALAAMQAALGDFSASRAAWSAARRAQAAAVTSRVAARAGGAARLTASA
jgi:hypothetical protein